MSSETSIHRRTALGLLPAAVLGSGSAGAARTIGAPDALSRTVLRRPLTAVDAGPGTFAEQVRNNFPRIIEQNIALRGPRATTQLVDGLNDQELSDLAILYTHASSAAGGSGFLLPMLASRLDDDRLLRVSDHFGFGPTYAALNAIAPQRTSRFATRANRGVAEPRIEQFRPKVSIGSLPDGVVNRPGFQRVGYVRTQWSSKYLYYTPYEIYLDFRTAPVGALAPAGAFWETATILSQRLGGAYLAGYAIGSTIVEPLIRNYAPSLYDKIGSTVAAGVDLLTGSWSGSILDQGIAQRATAPMFDASASQIQYFSLGGDWGVSSSWSTAFSSGGGCHPICIDVSY